MNALKKRSSSRFSSLVKSKPLHTSWKKKIEDKDKRKAVKLYENELKEKKQQLIEEKNRRRLENRKRKEENARKAEIVQRIRNVNKLKSLSKKQKRKLRKIDINK